MSTSVAEVSRFLARPGDFAYAVAEVTAAGAVRSMSISRQELLTTTGLRPRDLRAVAVPTNDPDSGPMLSSRRAGLLLGLGGVRAVVEKGRALLFGPRSRAVRTVGSGRKGGNERFSRLFAAFSGVSRAKPRIRRAS